MPIPRGKVFQLRNMMRLRGEPAQIRTLTGTGPSAVYNLYPCRVLVKGFAAKPLIAGITYGERHAIMLAEDVAASGLPNPLKIGNWIVVRDRTLYIASLDDSTYRDKGVLLAYDMKVTG